MENFILWILAGVLLFNFITFFIYWIDKRKAKKKAYRIPEKTLHILALLAGVYGAVSAMLLFRHKTNKKSFYLITILIFLINLGYIAGLIFLYINHWQ